MGTVSFGLGALAQACSSSTPQVNGDAGGGTGGNSASTGSAASSLTGITGSTGIALGSTAATGSSTATTQASAPSGTSSSSPASNGSQSSSMGTSSSQSVSTTTTTSPGTSSTQSSSSVTSQSSGGTGSVTCYAAPTKVYPEDGGGFYCPFSKVDGGSIEYCTGGTEHCCEPSTGTSSCEPIATQCGTGNTDWQCEGTPDCASMPGTICCGTGHVAQQAAQPGCGPDGGTLPAFPYVSGFTGSSCMTPSACTTFQICSQTTECSTGTCTPIRPKGNDIGYCN
jgi:hypothetical protein